MSYIKHHIDKLSPQQISKLLNAHAIRMKGGGHHVVNLSIEQSKKLHRAHMHGKAVSIRFDPFQIHHHQHLRGGAPPVSSVAIPKKLKGGATLKDQANNFYDRKIPDELKPGLESLGQSALGMAGFGLKKRGRPKKLKGGATLKDQANNFYDRKIPDELKPGMESLGQSALGMAGFGLKGGATLRDIGSNFYDRKIPDELKPGMESLGQSALGMAGFGLKKRGRPRKHNTTGKGFFDDMASGFQHIGDNMTETVFKPMARDAIDYGVPAAVGALTTMSGNPEFAPFTSYAASKATPSIKKSVGLGLRKRKKGKSKSGGALLAAGY